MIGPCLCGDPHCPSCGDPGAAAREAWVEHLDEITTDFDDIEARVFETVGMKAVEAFREAHKSIQDRCATEPDFDPDEETIFDEGRTSHVQSGGTG